MDIKFNSSVIIFLIGLAGGVIVNNATALDCPPPPKQFETEINAEARGEIKGALGKLLSGKLTGDISTNVENLIENYPNADKLFVIQGIMSMYCQLINESTDWSDDKKLEAIEKMNSKLLPFLYSPQKKTPN